MENSFEKRVFVFGSGIISKLLIRILSENGYEVINITRPNNKSNRLFALSPSNYEWIARFGHDLKESLPPFLLKKMKLFFGSHEHLISIDAKNHFIDALAYMVREDCIEKSVESFNLDRLLWVSSVSVIPQYSQESPVQSLLGGFFVFIFA